MNMPAVPATSRALQAYAGAQAKSVLPRVSAGADFTERVTAVATGDGDNALEAPEYIPQERAEQLTANNPSSYGNSRTGTAGTADSVKAPASPIDNPPEREEKTSPVDKQVSVAIPEQYRPYEEKGRLVNLFG
jgi:hypothetical protein